MVGHLLRDFQLATVAQILGDAGGAEGVATDFCLDPGLLGPPSDHAPDIGLAQGPARKRCAAPGRRAKEPVFPARLRRQQIGMQVLLKIVVARHFMLLAAFFLQPYPGAAALDIHILYLHFDHRADAGEGVDHQADQRPVAQAGDG